MINLYFTRCSCVTCIMIRLGHGSKEKTVEIKWICVTDNQMFFFTLIKIVRYYN